jgi:Arc/MetJ family transcription regulator
MVYGEVVPTLTATATGFVDGDSSSLLTGSIGTTATSTSGVGTYAFTIGTFSAGPNYIIDVTALATFTVTQAMQSITPIAGQSKAYGEALPLLTETATGFVHGNGESSFAGSLGTTATAGSPVDTYAFMLGTLSAGPNSTLNLDNSSTFAVTQATLTIVPTPGQSKAYGAAVPTLTESGSDSSMAILPRSSPVRSPRRRLSP